MPYLLCRQLRRNVIGEIAEFRESSLVSYYVACLFSSTYSFCLDFGFSKGNDLLCKSRYVVLWCKLVVF